jgi:hypothetical protein
MYLPYPDIGKKKPPARFRPVYQSYVDLAIKHPDGKSFRDTAEDVLIKRFLHAVSPYRRIKVKPKCSIHDLTFFY